MPTPQLKEFINYVLKEMASAYNYQLSGNIADFDEWQAYGKIVRQLSQSILELNEIEEFEQLLRVGKN